MRDTIDQFMWGFQQSFRRGLETSVEKVFEELGRPAPVTGFLIGLLKPGGDRHRLCIEPEDGPLVPADFEALDARAMELYLEDPESSMRHSHPLVHERRHRWAKERALGLAMREIIERHAAGGLACFVGMPTTVEQHLVFPIVAVPNDVVESLPTLNREFGDDPRWKVDPSIVRAAISEVLQQATRELNLPDAGEAAEIGADPDVILRTAVSRFARSLVVLSGNENGGALAEAMNRLSTLRYEQRVGVGRLLLAQRGTEGLDVDLGLLQPIRMKETRALRKLLELSGRGGPALLTDGDEVYGLGRLTDAYNPDTERAFELLVLGDGTWEMRHSSSALVTVRYGSPQLPEERLRQDRFADVVGRVFRAAGELDVAALWDIVVVASEAEHGTMIVISASAAEEAVRLSSQALPVEPAQLRSGLLHNVMAIDGAVLVDPSATCHGLGVILDGSADGGGDRSRGARYNSAIKYQASVETPTVIVIVSEDGMVNLVPELRPQIRCGVIEAAMDDLRSAAAIDPVHPERFYKAFGRVKDLRFYLSQAQCDEANQLCADHWERRRAAGASIWVHEEPLVPDPEMDGSYLIE